MKYPPVHYHDYLKMEALLGAQVLRSSEYHKTAHDEMLFIIVHQTYELWFKQILWELDSVHQTFLKPAVSGVEMARANHRLERIKEIQRLIAGQIEVLETMTPLDFLEFRDYLYPASGFQSFQFRMIETVLGLKNEARLTYNQAPFYAQLPPQYQDMVIEKMNAPSLFDCLQTWLERTPFLQVNDYDFWQSYQQAVKEMLEEDRQIVLGNSILSQEQKDNSLKQIAQTLETFATFADPQAYEKIKAQGHFRLSFKALHAALFIQMYRDLPLLQQPHRLLQNLMDIDENLTHWRYRHALMAHRMLGKKIGTGGSSGHQYLKDSTERHKIYSDFFNLSSYYIPRSKVPALPKNLQQRLGFQDE